MNTSARAVLAAAAIATSLPATAQNNAESSPAPGPSPVVVLVKVAKPWYAPRALMVSKFRDAIAQYDAVPGLAYKYFTLSEDSKFGGLYLWGSRARADEWFNDAWHARVLRERGVRGEVVMFDAPVVLNNMQPGEPTPGADGQAVASIVQIPIPAGIGRERLIAGFNKALPEYQAVPGLVRKYFIITQDGKFGGVYLWKSRATADAFFNAAWHERVRRAYSADATISWFDVPVVLPTRLAQTSAAPAKELAQ